MSQRTFLDKAWDGTKSAAFSGRNILEDEAVGRVENLVKSAISQTAPIGKSVVGFYRSLKNAAKLGNLEGDIISNSLDAILTSVRTGDASVLSRSLSETDIKTRKHLNESIREGFGQTSSTNDTIDEGVNYVSNWAYWKLWSR